MDGRNALTVSDTHSTMEVSSIALDHLIDIEAESIAILREVAAAFRRPILLFSGGKDSIVLTRLCEKAFWPDRIPFTFLHVDTGHNFPEVLEYRDWRVASLGADLLVGHVQEWVDDGRLVEAGGDAGRNRLQTPVLLESISQIGADAVIGGARRDEERSRSKERVYSIRDSAGRWDPSRQRPEPWGLLNSRHDSSEHFRVFPLSDWTEIDIWQYIATDAIPVPELYFSHEREVFARDGLWMPVSPWTRLSQTNNVDRRFVRFRTVGDMTCTAAVESNATDAFEVLVEVAASRISERGSSRVDDKVSEYSMEDRKREGYF